MDARIVIAVLSLALPAAPVCASDETDADYQLLDRWEEVTRDTAARTQRQLEQLEAELRTVRQRWAAGVVGKPYYLDGEWPSCEPVYRKVGEEDTPMIFAIGGGYVQPYHLTPPRTAAFSRADFDRWFGSFTAQFHRLRPSVEEGLEAFLQQVASVRQSLTEYDKLGDSMRHGDEWKARMHRDIMTGSGLSPDVFLLQLYRLVIDSHFQFIHLLVAELDAGNAFISSSGSVGRPPGALCVMLAEITQNSYEFRNRIATLEQVPYPPDREEQDRVRAELGEAWRKCDENEHAQRDDAAARIPVLRDRLYREREQLRQRMLRWREEAISAGPYDANDQAAISFVYGLPAELSAENVAAYSVGSAPKPFTPGGQSYGGGAAVGLSTPNLSVEIPRYCAGNYDFDGDGVDPVSVKYPDLEFEHPFILEIRLEGTRIHEMILSGASEQDTP